MTISDEKVVSLSYTLVVDGDVIETVKEDKPMRFIYGLGYLLPAFEEKQVTLTLKENPTEYFYGGGGQNGRFSHKGKAISIENQNSWTDGGVASPNPYYWSSNGYGMMWYTFKKGKYDFGFKLLSKR